MKVVFLDVDNVLNSSTWFRQTPTPRRFSVDPKCCVRVAKICEEADAAVVVSSSWRLRMKPSHLVDYLVKGGLPKRFIFGLTPHVLPLTFHDSMEEVSRGLEILRWLEGQGTVEKFVILDDKDDMDVLKDHLVQTNPEVGISDADVDAAISHLT